MEGYLLILSRLNWQSRRAGDICKDFSALLSSEHSTVKAWEASVLPGSVKRSSEVFLVFTMDSSSNKENVL